jgi:hypothetical protein
MRFTDRPTVQLGLDLQYPAFRVEERGPPAHRYSPTTSWHSSIRAAGLLAPFAMRTAFPSSDYYGASAPPRAFSGRCAYPAPDLAGRVRERHAMVPTFTA